MKVVFVIRCPKSIFAVLRQSHKDHVVLVLKVSSYGTMRSRGQRLHCKMLT